MYKGLSDRHNDRCKEWCPARDATNRGDATTAEDAVFCTGTRTSAPEPRRPDSVAGWREVTHRARGAMKVPPRPGERMRSHPLYRRKTKSKVVFDDQRPGWDSTSRDLTKYKLTDEQVEVSAAPAARCPASPVASPDRKRGRFQIHPPTRR